MSTACIDCQKPTGRPLARFCDACRWRHRVKPKKYPWTSGALDVLTTRYVGGKRGIAKEIAAVLGYPRWAVVRKAAELGLASRSPSRGESRPWAEAEESFLLEHAGLRPVSWMARRLRRPPASVACKAKRLKIRVGLHEGYTVNELQLCFGVDHRVLRRWVDSGKLRIQTRGYNGDRDAWAVTDEALWDFVTTHPAAFELHRVDQAWFMDLVISRGGRVRGVELLAS